MKHLKNILVFLALWAIAYYFGYTQGAAYDNQNNFKDFISIASALSGIVYIYYKYAR